MKIRIDKGYIKNALLGRTQFKRVYTPLSAENTNGKVIVGFTFASDWWRGLCEFPGK